MTELPVRPGLQLGGLVRGRPRRRLARALDAGGPFPGRLDDLPAALQRLAAGAVPPPAPPGDPTWHLLQARLETRFGAALGVGRLAAARPATAGDLLALVREQTVGHRPPPPRPVRPAFYRLRAAVLAVRGADRRAVRPSSRLVDLFPAPTRWRDWRRLSEEPGRGLPPFDRVGGPWWLAALQLLCVGLVYAVGVPAVQAVDDYSIRHGFQHAWWFTALGALLVPTTFVAGIGLGVALPMMAFRHRMTHDFPPDLVTVGDLARRLAEPAGTAVLTEREVWDGVRAAVAAGAGRRPLEVTAGTRPAAENQLARPPDLL